MRTHRTRAVHDQRDVEAKASGTPRRMRWTNTMIKNLSPQILSSL
ncbi:hypothetical protein [Streptomyces nitrosporeus]